MKRIIGLVLFSVLLVSCQQKEEPKPQYKFPTDSTMSVQSNSEEKMLRDVLAKDPANLNGWIRLGNMLMDNSRYAEAAEAYSKALDLDPKNVDVRVDMGTCYRNIGKPDLAVKEFNKALEYNPNHLNAHRNLGIVSEYDLKDKTRAIKEFEKYLQLGPNASDAEVVRQEIQKLKAAK